MINKKIVLVACSVILFASCKKNYNCTCTNDYGSYYAGEVEGTKRQAQKQCAKLGSSSTRCEIQ